MRLISTSLIALSLIACAPQVSQTEKPLNPVQEDFQFLYEGLQSGHVALYANKTKAEYDALYEATLSDLADAGSDKEIYMAFQTFAGFGDVAHASINTPADLYAPLEGDGAKTFPIYLRIVAGEAYIGDDYSGEPGLSAGDKILSMNGVPMADWLARTSELVSADTDYIAHSLLEFRFPDLLWLIEPDIETFDLVLESMEGDRKMASVPALSSDQQRANQTETAGFQLNSNARESRLLENGTAYLRPGPFYNYTDPDRTWDNSSFITFIDDAFESFIAAGSETLIIDLRQNPGGDNSFSDHMVSWIADKPFVFASEFLIRSSDEAEAANQARLDGNPGAAEGVSGLFAKEYKTTPRGETFSFKLPPAQPRTGLKFEGDVFVLINRHSYSQAVNVAATFQDYGWGTIVGEPTSDFATTYGSTESFKLPNTGLTVVFPKAHIIRPSGDRVPGGVIPEIRIDSPITPEADDVVLAELIAQISE